MSSVLPHKPAAELFGVPRVAKNARDRLLDTAIDLFYAHGFHAVGLDQVIAATGVTKTTFYKHFESKDDLIIAALERRDAMELAAWDAAVRKRVGDDPREQLLGYFDVMDAWFNDPSFHGCIFLNAASEFADPREPAHQTAAAHKRKSRDAWLALAEKAGAEDAATFTDLYTTLFEGALVMRHVHNRNDAARITRAMVKRLIDDYIPNPHGGDGRKR